MPFQCPPSPVIDGSLMAELLDHGMQPNAIVSIKDDCHINATWEIHGAGLRMIDGTWHIKALLESQGAGFEGQIGPTVDVPLSDGTPDPNQPGRLNYDATINISRNSVPKGEYFLVTRLTYTTPNGAPGPMAGFTEATMVQFFDPGP